MSIFFIQDIFRIVGVGTVLAGRVENGILRLGMRLNLNGKIMEVRAIEMNHKQVKESNEGEPIGVSVRLIRENENILKKVFANKNEEYNIIKDYKNKRVEFL